MGVGTRPATAEDAPFLAWVMQEAGRSHLEKGIWVVMLPGDDEQRLEFVAELATTETLHFCHWSRFLVAEVDGGVGVKPAYLDESGLPVFVRDAELRRRLLLG